MGKWITYCFDTFDLDFLKKPGVYVVYEKHRIIYIGSSYDVKKRIQTHDINFSRYSNTIQTPWGKFKKVKIKVSYTRKFGDWAMREIRLINRLKPKHNKVGRNG